HELAVQALSSTERGYDLLAPKFDYTPFRTPRPILDAVAAHLKVLAPFPAGLDVCCGTGAGMELLRPLCRDRVVGIDFSRGGLEGGARGRAPGPGRRPLGFRAGQGAGPAVRRGVRPGRLVRGLRPHPPEGRATVRR